MSSAYTNYFGNTSSAKVSERKKKKKSNRSPRRAEEQTASPGAYEQEHNSNTGSESPYFYLFDEKHTEADYCINGTLRCKDSEDRVLESIDGKLKTQRYQIHPQIFTPWRGSDRSTPAFLSFEEHRHKYYIERTSASHRKKEESAYDEDHRRSKSASALGQSTMSSGGLLFGTGSAAAPTGGGLFSTGAAPSSAPAGGGLFGNASSLFSDAAKQENIFGGGCQQPPADKKEKQGGLFRGPPSPATGKTIDASGLFHANTKTKEDANTAAPCSSEKQGVENKGADAPTRSPTPDLITPSIPDTDDEDDLGSDREKSQKCFAGADKGKKQAAETKNACSTAASLNPQQAQLLKKTRILAASSHGAEGRRLRRLLGRLEKGENVSGSPGAQNGTGLNSTTSEEDDARVLHYLTNNEDELLEFVAQVNKVYQEKLKKPAPFMTFILIGMQSAGKSTIVERFLQRVINVVKEGTGTRCPLDITCIHDANAIEPVCELSGCKQPGSNGVKLSVEDVFRAVTAHNFALAQAEKFSKDSLFLIVRSKNVQNMRFVDLPGIISNKSKGIDNRDDIKGILKAEMNKPNSRMCVLLEPKEFATNPIVDFIDQTMCGRENWVDKATFFMTKFDMRLGDSRTGSKANAFFQEFRDNGVVPFMVITPTLPTEKLDPDEMFKQRQELLSKADQHESEEFHNWVCQHRNYFDTHPEDEELLPCYKEKMGFRSGVNELREQMLADTAKRLPEVLTEIRKQLKHCETEHKLLREREKYNDPQELRLIVAQVLHKLTDRIFTYLDGSLEIAMKFPDKLQTLEDEIIEEDQSDWASRELNHLTEEENRWRDFIAKAAEETGEYPEQVQPEQPFLGGKQYQRAVQFFRCNMIDQMPEPHKLKQYVPMATGYLQGGLQRENWERAIVEIIKHCVKQVTHPGINFFVKHVGSIFRRLFSLALDDIRKGEEFSATFQLLPATVENFLRKEFDTMLWKLMQAATEKTQCSLEPMYTTVNPNLPTFVTSTSMGEEALGGNEKEEEKLYVWDVKLQKYVEKQDTKAKKKKDREPVWLEQMTNKVSALFSGSGAEAKKFLQQENLQRAQTRKEFLSDKRTAMITKTETGEILQRSFEYIAALMEFNLVTLEFQFNHYLYQGFKDALNDQFSSRLIIECDFSKLVDPDPDVKRRAEDLETQIEGLRTSLQHVARMQDKLRG
ncbi:unnamed protein product [Amoebophrya sp. A120]|nr:unnamed protein product [Amoebophrya sp. A120]|eukprot:GSA120T00008037001.1